MVRANRFSQRNVLEERYFSLLRSCPEALSLHEKASQVIMFGSMAAGLHRSNSDIDVLMIGVPSRKIKNRDLDLVAVPNSATRSPIWQQCELASHVATYGQWIVGEPDWTHLAKSGPLAEAGKRRRVNAFLQSLSSRWFSIDSCFQGKYAIKVRRETQRLILIEQGVPVPPTRLLDEQWHRFAQDSDLLKRLETMSAAYDSRFSSSFLCSVESCLNSGVGTRMDIVIPSS